MRQNLGRKWKQIPKTPQPLFSLQYLNYRIFKNKRFCFESWAIKAKKKKKHSYVLNHFYAKKRIQFFISVGLRHNISWQRKGLIIWCKEHIYTKTYKRYMKASVALLIVRVHIVLFWLSWHLSYIFYFISFEVGTILAALDESPL